MVEEETRREKDNSCFEFSSLNRENGIIFASPRHRKFLESKLSKQDIFDIHVCKFKLWEYFGFQRIFLLAPWNSTDIATMVIVSNRPESELLNIDDDPKILTFAFKPEELDKELISLENLIYQYHQYNIKKERIKNGYFNS